MEMDATMNSKSGEIFLQVTQSIESAEVLHYLELLGGGIYKDSSRTGKRKAVLKRQVSGSKMRHVAALLGQILWMKQAQLKIAAGGNIEGPRRERIGEQLLQLKQKDHTAKKFKCTWSYFAGFFDAKGSVTAKALPVALELQGQQLNPFTLERLLGFLHDSTLARLPKLARLCSHALKWQAGFVGYHDFLSVSLSLLASGAGAGQVLESEEGAFWLIGRSYYPSIDPSLVPKNSVRIQELGTWKSW